MSCSQTFTGKGGKEMKRTGMSLIVLATLCASCAPTQLGDNYGSAYYTMMENQILDPKAGRTQDPVQGMDSKAALTAIERYRETFQKRDAEFNKSLVTTGVRTN
jgi:hypothetical protein